MSFENKLGRVMRDTGPARFLVPVGIILIIAGILFSFVNTKSYKEVEGVVTDVIETTNADGQKEYTVIFDFETLKDQVITGQQFSNLSKAYKVGDKIKVFYDPNDPTKNTNSKSGPLLPIILIVLGVVATAAGIYLTVKAFKKSKQLDQTAPVASAQAKADLDGFKTAQGVTEYYFRWDRNSLRPGYILEDADRKALYEGKMLKNALVGARKFEFTDHTTGVVTEHDVGHTGTLEYGDEFFSMKSSFKFDGKNVWDVVHERGLRIDTSLISKFPYLKYDVTKNGEAFARIESTSVYVHEDEEAQHAVTVPTGNMFYRCWTNSKDFDSLFLTIFAISENTQTVVE